ncbi:MAG: hypothetical protein FRX48_05933 [Lasallia pustulata]|uniref:DUF647 domain-containing protein n=1 Tax=Lasallia pustulata TaxID=136370 RepID=A0A5M8PLZ1_9LECA|nr:MAG: hypothetical protein FRX48_05933 [Lasallia pustulata]
MAMLIDERDESGTLVARYVSSKSGKDESGSRIDIINTNKRASIWQRGLNVFLPAGYPHSVTKDYLEYQIYDSLQAFSSSIAGLLSSRAVLIGVGVGDASASPTAALLLSVLQDSMGRIATILFAHQLGTSLEPECKMYRLAADVFNDCAMILDCLSPALPKIPRVILLSFSSVLRALCGVAAGSSKASLSAHFAKWGNLGELNAKDSSQETVISLVGMLAGTLVVAHASSQFATWATLMLLLSIHIAMNHAAVRAVSLHTLNRQRANIVLSNFLANNGEVLTPDEVSSQERIFELDGVLRWKGSKVLGRAKIGVSLASTSLASRHGMTGDRRIGTVMDMAKLADVYRHEEYMLWYEAVSRTAYIVLKVGASPTSQLKAWTHALWTAHRHAAVQATGDALDQMAASRLTEATLKDLSLQWSGCLERLKSSGWDTEVANLETVSGTRIQIHAGG